MTLWIAMLLVYLAPQSALIALMQIREHFDFGANSVGVGDGVMVGVTHLCLHNIL